MFAVFRQRRWLALAALVVAMSLLFWRLGLWQWHRYEDRLETRHWLEQAESQDPVPIAQLLDASAPLAAAAANRAVTATGTYDGSGQLLQRNPNGRSGYEVLTPLHMPNGQTVVVDRGWVGASQTAENQPAGDVRPPSGTVKVVLRLEPFDEGSGRTAPTGQTYDIAADAFGNSVLPAYGQLMSQEPAPPDAIALPEGPSTGLGPHLFYAIQWWLFIGIALIGYVLLLGREALDQAELPNQTPSLPDTPQQTSNVTPATRASD